MKQKLSSGTCEEKQCGPRCIQLSYFLSVNKNFIDDGNKDSQINKTYTRATPMLIA